MMDAVAGSERVWHVHIVRGGAPHLLKCAPGTGPPDILHLVARGLRDMVHVPVGPPNKHIQNPVEIAVAHLMGHRGGVEFRREHAPKLLPVPTERVRAVLPGVMQVGVVEHTEYLHPPEKRVDGNAGVKGQVATPPSS